VESTFLYENGQFVPADPLGLTTGPLSDLDDALEAMGYNVSQIVGDENGLHYQVFEHEQDGWVIVFCTIACGSWPDFISLLNTLSVTALAGALTDTDADGRKSPCHMPTGPVKPCPRRKQRGAT
jgi:hypothetical protein